MLIRGLIALSFGTLGLGITEYVAMGLLPYWSEAFDVSIAESGHAISAYALGVALGAFVIILLRTFKLKTILLMLICVHILGNAFTAFAPSFETMLVSRFVAGLPHGAFFGVGSIIAQRLAAKGKGTSAVAIMVSGMTIANIFGVPLGTALAHALSWRTIFYIVVVWGVLVFVSSFLWIRDTGKIEDTGFKGQFVFLKHPAPWLVLGATMFGNAGIFCMHSYISPLLTDLAGIPLQMVSAVLVAMGVCMVIFNLISGRLCDRFTPGKVSTLCQVTTIFLLLAIAAFGSNPVVMIVLVCLVAGMLFAVSAPEQVSILRVAPGGLLLGASAVQAAFNLGNAMGAYVGGLPFELDLSIRYVTIFGAVLAALGAYMLYVFTFKHEMNFPDPAAEQKAGSDAMDAVAQVASESLECGEYGMSDEVAAKHEIRKKAHFAAEAARHQVYAEAKAAQLAKAKAAAEQKAQDAQAQTTEAAAPEKAQAAEDANAPVEEKQQKADVSAEPLSSEPATGEALPTEAKTADAPMAQATETDAAVKPQDPAEPPQA